MTFLFLFSLSCEHRRSPSSDRDWETGPIGIYAAIIIILNSIILYQLDKVSNEEGEEDEHTRRHTETAKEEGISRED